MNSHLVDAERSAERLSGVTRHFGRRGTLRGTVVKSKPSFGRRGMICIEHGDGNLPVGVLAGLKLEGGIYPIGREGKRRPVVGHRLETTLFHHRGTARGIVRGTVRVEHGDDNLPVGVLAGLKLESGLDALDREGKR